MMRYLPQWSLTRRKIFTNCARRFALQYFKRDKAKMVRTKSLQFIAHHDLMIKCTRIVFFELLNNNQDEKIKHDMSTHDDKDHEIYK